MASPAAIMDRLSIQEDDMISPFESMVAKALSTKLDSAGYVAAQVWSEEQDELLSQYMRSSGEERSKMWMVDGQIMAVLFLGTLAPLASSRPEEVVMSLIYEALCKDDVAAQAFYQCIHMRDGTAEAPAVKSIFTQFLSPLNANGSPFHSALCLEIVTILLNKQESVLTTEDAGSLAFFANEVLSGNTSLDMWGVKSALGAITAAARDETTLSFFVDAHLLPLVYGTVQRAVSNVEDLRSRPTNNSHNADVGVPAGVTVALCWEVLYFSLYFLWVSSYTSYGQKALAPLRVGPITTSIARLHPPKKVLRVLLAVCGTLLSAHGDGSEEEEGFGARFFAGEMAEAHLRDAVLNCYKDDWDDEEMDSDFEVIADTLASGAMLRNAFESYQAEIMSGRLEWGHLHKNEDFWRLYQRDFAKNNFEPIRMLVALVKGGTCADESLAIAAHDLGQFSRLCESGKEVLRELNAKAALLPLLTHSSEDVQREVINTVQSLLVGSWRRFAVPSSA